MRSFVYLLLAKKPNISETLQTAEKVVAYNSMSRKDQYYTCAYNTVYKKRNIRQYSMN